MHADNLEGYLHSIIPCIYSYALSRPQGLAMGARKETLDWRMVTKTSAVEWSSVMVESGGRCVMMAGAVTRLESCAES